MGRLAEFENLDESIQTWHREFDSNRTAQQLFFDVERYIALNSYGLAELTIEHLEGRVEDWQARVAMLRDVKAGYENELVQVYRKQDRLFDAAKVSDELEAGLITNYDLSRTMKGRITRLHSLYYAENQLVQDIATTQESINTWDNYSYLLADARKALDLATAERVYIVETTSGSGETVSTVKHLSESDARNHYFRMERDFPTVSLRVWSYCPLVNGQTEYLADSKVAYCSFRLPRLSLVKVGN